MSFNRWNYVNGNPIRYTDASGQEPRDICPWGWNEWAVNKRVDVAEKYVSPTSDPMDTYTAAGIAIQCAGWDKPWPDKYQGVGIAQVSQIQAETEWGEPIYEYNIFGKQVYEKDGEGNIKYENGKPVPVIRGYGLRLRCPDGDLEKVLNPANNKAAVILMKRRLQLVIDECNNCTDTDRYIAAALSQNGPGFHLKNMRGISNISSKVREEHGNADVKKDWFSYFRTDVGDGNMTNTKTQLYRFNLVIDELRSRRWILPDIDSNVIEELENWQVNQ